MVKRKKSKVSMPSSAAGLMRYMDEEGKGIKLKPEHVAFICIAIIVIKIFTVIF